LRLNLGFASLLLVALAIGTVTTLCVETAHASTCDVTEFTGGQTLTAERLNQRVRQVEACLNGNVGNANWNSSEQLQVTNLANQKAFYMVSVQLPCGTKANAFNFKVPAASTFKGWSVTCRDCAAADHTLVLQLDASTKITTNLTNSTTTATFSNADSVSTSNVVNVDTTQTVAGGCTAYDIMMAFTATHTT
jgi:hypothetical protein